VNFDLYVETSERVLSEETSMTSRRTWPPDSPGVERDSSPTERDRLSETTPRMCTNGCREPPPCWGRRLILLSSTSR
jgi:hypothetical protein